MVECLILGAAGIGKTSLVTELQRRGRVAYDADDVNRVPGLSGWFAPNGQPCAYNSSPQWRAGHRFLWDLERVAALVNDRDRTRHFYFAGTSHNDLQAMRLFAHTVVLDADVETLCTRYIAPDRNTPYLSDDVESDRAWLTEVQPGLRLAWRALGAVVPNTTRLSIPEVADHIMAFEEG